MKPWLKRSLLILAIAFVAIQFVPVPRTNPPVDPHQTLAATMPVPREVSAIFERSCQDCHTHLTRWPWYSYVAPVSWKITNDVKEGRRHMNMSVWGTYDYKRKDNKYGDFVEQITMGEMPEEWYAFIHRRARLNEHDKKAIIDWAEASRKALAYKKEESPSASHHDEH